MNRVTLFPGLPLLLGLLLSGITPIGIDAQSEATLEQIDALTRDGRVGPAREALLDWWDREWGDASRSDRERALWLRGNLTLEPTEAASSYRRIVAEFPGGLFTDQALLRLGHIAALRGDTLTASRWFTVLERDHPGSPLRSGAQAWLGLPEVQAALARGEVEREATRAAQAETAAPDVPSPTPRTESSGRHAVQLGAFSARDRAETLARRVREAGFDVRVVRVPDSDLWRVRAGRFPDPEVARSLRDRLADADFEVVLVTDADREVDGGEAGVTP